ncbi:hypothetical protein ABTM60_19910, partial [Acinetobacter baumannii]
QLTDLRPTDNGVVDLDVLVDLRAFEGQVRFVDRPGAPLPLSCAMDGGSRQADGGDPSRRRDNGELLGVAVDDIATTEVHFFREDDLA